MVKYMYMTRAKFKQKCIKLRLQNYTLGEIEKILNRPKTSIYDNIRAVPLNKTLQNKLLEIKRANIDKLRALGLTTQRGVSWKKRHCIEFTKWTPNLVSLVSHIIFDGEIRNYGIMYHNRSVVLLNQFKNGMRAVYKYEPKEKHKLDDVTTLAYYNVELSDFLKKKKGQLLKNIKYFSRELKKAFLRAFFDDEGNITFNHRKKIVRGFQHNIKTLSLVKILLFNFGIKSRIDKKYFEIDISRRENLIKFAREINFSGGVCINGNRSNSIWKQSFEKRKILEMALSSYKS